MRRLDTVATGFSLGVSSRGVLLGPLFGCGQRGVLVGLPLLGDVVGERVVGVGRGEQSLDGEQDSADL